MPREAGLVLQDNIQVLQGEMREVRKNVDALSARQVEHYRTLLAKVEGLASNMQDLSHNSQSQDADLSGQLEKMVQDVQELRGAVEVNEHRLGETQVKLEQTLADRLDALRKQMALNETPVSNTAASKIPKDPHGALIYANGLIKAKRFVDARAALRTIVKIWPKQPGVTDEALARLGDTYLADKKYDAALREYIPIIDQYTKGRMVDNAYYKIGLCSLELGRYSDAITFFNEVINNHKNSIYAKSAKIKLAEVMHRQQKKEKSNSKSPPPLPAAAKPAEVIPPPAAKP